MNSKKMLLIAAMFFGLSNITTVTAKDATVYDQKFHALITKNLFNANDTTPLQDIILDIICILENKKDKLDPDLKDACNQLISVLKKNINTTDFHTWAAIIKQEIFLQLLPEETKAHIKEIGELRIGFTLLTKLQNA